MMTPAAFAAAAESLTLRQWAEADPESFADAVRRCDDDDVAAVFAAVLAGRLPTLSVSLCRALEGAMRRQVEQRAAWVREWVGRFDVEDGELRKDVA